MTRAWWPVGCAAAFLLWASAVPASAQTFLVRHAPAGSAVEVSFGAGSGKATADQSGDARVVLTGSPADTAELAAAIYADNCGSTVRLVLVGRTAEPPLPGADCQRRSVPGYFVMRRETSIVIDLEPSIPIVRIRQGRVPGVWLLDGPIPTGRTTPRGLVLFGAGGMGTMQETVDQLCGNSSPCARENTKLNIGGGAAFWMTRWLAAEGSFIKASGFIVTGEGEDYEMVGKATPRFLTVAALGGYSIRSARFYGRLGAAYHRAQIRVTQGTFQRVISQDGITTTYPPSTQEFKYETVGWGRLMGAGVEGWVSDSTALYAEVNFIRVEGDNADNGGERIMHDRLRTLLAGVKVHLGRQR